MLLEVASANPNLAKPRLCYVCMNGLTIILASGESYGPRPVASLGSIFRHFQSLDCRLSRRRLIQSSAVE